MAGKDGKRGSTTGTGAPASSDRNSLTIGPNGPILLHVGGTDPDAYAKAKAANRINDLPTNHNPRFLPVIHPTLETGVEALVVAARTWLAA